jgi:hypothetical protein
MGESTVVNQYNKYQVEGEKANSSNKIFRILGLMALISYMIVILFTWIFANLDGYVYFSAGEPVLSIKYIEWVLGFLGIFVATYYLHKELNDGTLY